MKQDEHRTYFLDVLHILFIDYVIWHVLYRVIAISKA